MSTVIPAYDLPRFLLGVCVNSTMRDFCYMSVDFLLALCRLPLNNLLLPYTRPPRLVPRAYGGIQALVFLANLANNALNQSHVGASSAIELAVSACKHCGCPRCSFYPAM